MGGEIHPRLDAFEGDSVLLEESATCIGHLIELFGAALGFSDDIILLFEQRQRRIDRPGARSIGAAEFLLDGADQVIAVARLLGDEGQENQPQVAVAEHPPAPSPEAAPAEALFLVMGPTPAAPAPARRAIMPPFTVAPMILMMTSKHEIYPLIVFKIDT